MGTLDAYEQELPPPTFEQSLAHFNLALADFRRVEREGQIGLETFALFDMHACRITEAGEQLVESLEAFPDHGEDKQVRAAAALEEGAAALHRVQACSRLNPAWL